MRDGFGMFLVLFLPLVSLYYLAALINPKWFSRSKVTTSRLHIVLSYALLVLCWVFLVIFASGAGGAWWLVLALLPAYFSARAYQFKPEPKKPEPQVTTPTQIAAPLQAKPTPTAAPTSSENATAINIEAQNLANADVITQFAQKRAHSKLHRVIYDIVADGVVSIDEARYLARWIEQNPALNDPKLNDLSALIRDYVRDDELSHAEEADLLQRLSLWVGFEVREPQTTPLTVNTSQDWTGMTIEFDYVAATGEASHRRVKVQKDGADRIYGYCHARRAMRTFLKDRMDGAVDTETGELLLS